MGCTPVLRRLIALAALFSVSPALAETVFLRATKDTTIYAGVHSNGAGQSMVVGRIDDGADRRALVAFDVAGSIPEGAVIGSVELRILVRNVPPASPLTVRLSSATSDWGEGTSNADGQDLIGVPSTPGDATWEHTFYPNEFWDTLGGDLGGLRDLTPVSQEGPYTWGSNPLMVADVQSWLDDPSTNYGWFLFAELDSFPSWKRFETREGPIGPTIIVTYSLPTDVPASSRSGLVAAALSLLLGVSVLWARRRRS